MSWSPWNDHCVGILIHQLEALSQYASFPKKLAKRCRRRCQIKGSMLHVHCLDLSVGLALLHVLHPLQ
ncbi:hypothetical protein ATANTOWER_018501 [Ataeniobius toweri]|uniref:Uncharacterized protein n=1 Tax=Ataeniobius toweri TaxID=208326 RepID=A0ABU7A2B2_9TELE|nr:hypothetical protein [Ataeniobius toweri]